MYHYPSTIAIPQKIDLEVSRVSRDLGISREDFTVNALSYYLKNLRARIELKHELDAWNQASDEDFATFESTL